MGRASCLLQNASPPGMFSFACQKRTRKAPATFEAREARTRGCSPLVTPKLLGSIQKIQAAPLKDFLCSADFEFLSSSSIWCHPVISSDIWFPLCKGKIHASTNNNLKYPRFFDAFFLYSVFSVWTAQMEIGGMFRRDAGQNAPLLRHKTKGKSRIMNQNQAKEYYKKLFVNYPDVLSVEEATTLLGFKSQTAIIRRIHQHRIRCLKVGRSFMIPKEYLIDYLLDS